MATVIEAEERVKSVRMEGLALLKIVKHCHESLPQMVTGSLLGLVNSEGVLEITHSFSFPEATAIKTAAADDDEAAGDAGHEFQLEMMRMLREVNVDNNCVGWYQSMYLGSFCTSSFLENQLSYQTDLSANAVVVLYDPMQTTHGNLVLRCFRLSQQYLDSQAETAAAAAAATIKKNAFMDASQIFEELPVHLVNPGLVKALLADAKFQESSSATMPSTDFMRLDLSTNPYLEKHLEFLCSWVDDLASEQHKFQYYARSLNRKQAQQREQQKSDAGMPSRLESLLITHQIETYCSQMDKFASGGFEKLFLAGALHKKQDNGNGVAAGGGN